VTVKVEMLGHFEREAQAGPTGGGHALAWRMALDLVFMDAQEVGVGRLHCHLGLPALARAIEDRAFLRTRPGQRVADAWLGVEPSASQCPDLYRDADRVYTVEYRPYMWGVRRTLQGGWRRDWQWAIYPPGARVLGSAMWLATRVGWPRWHDRAFRRLAGAFVAANGPAHYYVAAWRRWEPYE